MLEHLSKIQLLGYLICGHRLEAHPRTPYSGEEVEFLPRKDKVNNHPDCYPWHVIDRPDYDRLRHSEVVVSGVAPESMEG